MAGRRSRFAGSAFAWRWRFVVAGSLGVVYLIVVPSLEAELIDAKLDQLEEDAQRRPRIRAREQIGSDQQFTEQAASIFQARVVIYSIFQDQPFIFGDSNPTSSSMSPEIRRRWGRCARARWSAAPTSAGAGGSPRWRFRSSRRVC